MDISRLSLNTATVKEQWSLLQCIEGCQRHGIPSIGPWRDKVHECGVERAAQAIRAAGLHVSGLCRGGMFTAPDAAGRQVALDDNRLAVDEAAALGADCLVLVVGGLPGGSKDIMDARNQVHDGISALLDHARACKVPLAIEPLHPMYAADRACVNTLGQANDICDELGEGVGVAIDAYHVWWDPDLAAEVNRARGRILGYHLCDWLVPTRDLLVDRGMMGDGIIDLKHLGALVEQAGYTGPVEVEIFSRNDWWTRDADDVLRIMIERFETNA